MAKELFTIAAQGYKESQREIRRRKTIIIGCWIFAIVVIAYAVYILRYFPWNISFQELASERERQVVLAKAVIAFLMGLSALMLS